MLLLFNDCFYELIRRTVWRLSLCVSPRWSGHSWGWAHVAGTNARLPPACFWVTSVCVWVWKSIAKLKGKKNQGPWALSGVYSPRLLREIKEMCSQAVLQANLYVYWGFGWRNFLKGAGGKYDARIVPVVLPHSFDERVHPLVLSWTDMREEFACHAR